jgi:N6-adenosine-specific RNA methylase IME4
MTGVERSRIASPSGDTIMLERRFRTIVADPPWPYDNKDGPRATAEHRPNSWDTACTGSAPRYGSMSMPELKAIGVKGASDNPAHLYLWTTNSFMVEAHDLARAWGFVPKTIVTWGKTKADGTPSMKTGYYYRGATEHFLFAVKGSMRLVGEAAPTLFLSNRLPHSVKPAWFYSLVEAQSPGPYLEMFARQQRLGWSSWGDQVPETVSLTSRD